MASFLKIPNRDKLDLKFKRAVNSFIKQNYEDKELIIVSDGCEKTIELYQQNFNQYENIKLIPIPKQRPYSGQMRNIAIDASNGDIITYLDSDDVIGKNHLKIISEQFDLNDWDWIYSDDLMLLDKNFTKFHLRKVETRWGSIGTSAISHKNPKLLKNGEYLKWGDGYSHDWVFCMKLASLGYRFKKLEKRGEYIVCHYAGFDD